MLPRGSAAAKKAKRNVEVGMNASSSSPSAAAARAAALSLLESSGDEHALEKLVAEFRERVDDG